jgi:hypothetical protein
MQETWGEGGYVTSDWQEYGLSGIPVEKFSKVRLNKSWLQLKNNEQVEGSSLKKELPDKNHCFT